jgi:hypothetical protein
VNAGSVVNAEETILPLEAGRSGDFSSNPQILLCFGWLAARVPSFELLTCERKSGKSSNEQTLSRLSSDRRRQSATTWRNSK